MLDQSQQIPSSDVEDYLEEKGQVNDGGMELGELQDAHEGSSPQATGAISHAVQGGPGGRESQAGPKKPEVSRERLPGHSYSRPAIRARATVLPT